MNIIFLSALAYGFHLTHNEKSIKIPLKKKDFTNLQVKSISHLKSPKYPAFISSQSTILLENYSNQQYVGTVGIGTPPQWLTVIFDTGSGNFFINSELCTSDSCQSREAYDHELSNTYSTMGLPLQVSFGSGSMEGVLGSDTLTVGKIQIPGQNFAEVVYEMGSIFYGCEFSGIMGLGFNTLAHDSTVPVFDNIVESGVLEWNVFAFFFSLDPDVDSELVIGNVDNSKFSGNIHWVPVTEDPYYWTVLVTDVRFGHKSTGLCKNGCLAAIDTGTTLMLAPSKDLDVLYDHLGMTCEFSEMPDLVFVIDGKDYRIPATTYMISVHNGEQEDPGIHSEKNPDECLFAFIALDVDPPYGPVWVFGNIFMNSFYVAFDRDQMSVGFGRSINNHKNL